MKAIGVVLVFYHAFAVGPADELSARMPCVGPPGVGGDVADRAADHRIVDPVDPAGGQFVLPVGVPVLIVIRIVGAAQRSGGIAVALFVQDVVAAVTFHYCSDSGSLDFYISF